jgi:hypothetical protein
MHQTRCVPSSSCWATMENNSSEEIRRLSLLKINPSTYAVLIINQPRSPSTAGADASR